MNRPTADPSQEGSLRSSASSQFPSWEGLGVGSWSRRTRSVNRRNFLRTATVATTALAGLSLKRAFCAENAAEKTNWPIGCFNRAWTKWSYDDALDGIHAAGYRLTGLLSSQRDEAFTSSAATPDYLDGLKKRIAQRGLAVNVIAIRFKPDAALADNITDLRKQIENAARLELKFMLTFGVDQSKH